MKPNLRFTPSALTWLVLIGAALTAGSMFAGAITGYDLVLTENSSTSLSLSYNGTAGNSGFSVSNTSADHWTITITSAELNIATSIAEWNEPEGTNAVNKVTTNSSQLLVTSDLALALDGAALPQGNNTRWATPIGFEIDQAHPIFLTFNDAAERTEAAVPDGGSNLAFLAFSLVLVMGARHLRFPRRA